MTITPYKTSWDLSTLVADESIQCQKAEMDEIEHAYATFVSTWKKRSDYLQDVDVLYQALNDFESLMRTHASANTRSYYYSLKLQLEQDNAQLKAKANILEHWSNDLNETIRFFEQNLSKISLKNQTIFLTSEKLASYTHYLERLFVNAKYLLSLKEERILSLCAKSSYSNWVDMTQTLLSTQETDVLTETGESARLHFSQLFALLDSTQKNVRDSAAQGINTILQSCTYPIECELNSVLEDKMVKDKIRKTKRPDEIRHANDDIETSVVDTMIGVVASHFDISTSFYALKAKLLGLEKLQFHERNVRTGDLHVTYTFEEAFSVVKDVFSRLDPEFESTIELFARNGQIDVYPKKGKASGAFCAHHLLINPTYILLNFSGQLTDVTTLAHELGHGINNELMRKTQNALNFESPTSTAEVASTFMEDFVIDRLLVGQTKENQLSLLMSTLDRDISTIFRQVAAYQFEQELHATYRKIGYLSAKQIGTLFLKHMKDYMGDSVIQSPGSENWWMYWTHFRSYFYVYSYASGQLISKSLQDMVRKDHKAIDIVKKFLQSGMSYSPKELFLHMQIHIDDASFWEAGIMQIQHSLNRANDLAKELGKIE